MTITERKASNRYWPPPNPVSGVSSQVVYSMMPSPDRIPEHFEHVLNCLASFPHTVLQHNPSLQYSSFFFSLENAASCKKIRSIKRIWIYLVIILTDAVEKLLFATEPLETKIFEMYGATNKMMEIWRKSSTFYADHNGNYYISHTAWFHRWFENIGEIMGIICRQSQLTFFLQNTSTCNFQIASLLQALDLVTWAEMIVKWHNDFI